MTTHINAAKPPRHIVPKSEEIRRKQDGTWDPSTMVSETSAEGAALKAGMVKVEAPMSALVKSEIIVEPPPHAQDPQPDSEISIDADDE